MGVGTASGKDKAEEAAKLAISSPLLETSIEGARGILVNITASPDIGLDEVDTAIHMITDEADSDARVIFGAVIDENMEDEMRITVIATGFKKDGKEMAATRNNQNAANADDADEDAVSAEDIFEIFKKKK